MATRFPDSPRIATYKARAGSGGASDLIGSAIGAPIAAVLGVLSAFGELTVEDGVVEEEPPSREP